MPLIKQCEVCNGDFRTKPFFVKIGAGKYCSKECHYKGMKTGQLVNCFLCKKEVYKTKKALNGSKSKNYFCNRSCQTKWRNSIFIGPKHANWKHGRDSYRSVLSRHNVPKICKLCKTADKRVLAVHHRDRNRSNNIVDNLAWLCHNCHFLVHRYNAGEKEGLLK